MPNLYYLNSLFDLELGGFSTGSVMQAAAEMTTLFVPVARAGDYVLLDVRVPDEYWAYLSLCGIECPTPVRGDERIEGLHAVAWGYNEQSASRLAKLGATCRHPDLSVVRMVNSRLYSQRLCAELGLGVRGAEALETLDSVERALASREHFPAVIKPAFGNAGYGFMVKESKELSEGERARLEEILRTCGTVTVEPWLERVLDISSRCDIAPDGTVGGMSHHVCHANAAGTFFAILLDPADSSVAHWRAELGEAGTRVAAALHRDGYFGPACFDSFVWRDAQGEEQLSAVVEINARHAISTVAYALRDHLAAASACYLRLIGRRRHELPDTYRDLKKILGADSFRRSTRRGVVLVTPLRVAHNGHWQQPSRSAFFIAAPSAEETLRIDERLRTKLCAR